MSYQLGHRDRPAGNYEVSHLNIVLHYRKTSHPELLDIEIEAASFADKRAEWHDARAKLFAKLKPFITEDDDKSKDVSLVLTRMPEGERDAWVDEFLALKSNITSADVEPVFGFIDAHILEIDGVSDRDGSPVTRWLDISHDDRLVLLGDIPPHEIAAIYTAIRDTVAMSADQKKG